MRYRVVRYFVPTKGHKSVNLPEGLVKKADRFVGKGKPFSRRDELVRVGVSKLVETLENEAKA